MRKTKYGSTYRISDYNVRHSDIDIDQYQYLTSMVSELKNMKLYHEAYAGTHDMISFHLGKAIEYCERNIKEIEERSQGTHYEKM